MNKYIKILFYFVSLLLITGCSNDFLEENKKEKPGNSKIEIDKSSLDFGYSLTSLDINIGNVSGNETLTWTIQSLPQWLTASTTNGSISAYSSQNIVVTCNRSGLEPKVYEGVIVIKSNDNSQPSININISMLVRRAGNLENILALEGTVTDSYYSKVNDELYILTQNPNRLAILKSGHLTYMQLPKAPNCITVSENGQSAYIGYSALMTEVNLKSQQVSKQIELDFNVHNIAYGENSWCYLTVRTSGYFDGLYNVNLQTSKISLSVGQGSVNENTNLLKIKGKPVIIASREDTSPNGVFYINISNGVVEQTRYWHQSLGGKLWSTEDGEYIIGNTSRVYKTPKENSSSNDLPELGKLGSNSYQNLRWIDHNQNTKLFFTLNNTYYDGETKIMSYDAENFYLKNTIPFNDEYYTTINNRTDFYKVEYFYLFSNKTGNELYAIRNLKKESFSEETKNDWSIEIISVK